MSHSIRDGVDLRNINKRREKLLKLIILEKFFKAKSNSSELNIFI